MPRKSPGEDPTIPTLEILYVGVLFLENKGELCVLSPALNLSKIPAFFHFSTKVLGGEKCKSS